MEMSEKQIKAKVIMNIIDNRTTKLDNTGQERYCLNGQQFGKCVDALVKNINVIHCCMGEAEQLVCDNKCEWTRYPKNGIWYDGCVKCGKEVAD